MSEGEEKRGGGDRRTSTEPYDGPEKRVSERRLGGGGDALNAAISRLTEFRATWNTGDQIDEYSRLTADDLDLVLDAARKRAEIDSANPTMPELG